jgi:hypothetical protein
VTFVFFVTESRNYGIRGNLLSETKKKEEEEESEVGCWFVVELRAFDYSFRSNVLILYNNTKCPRERF